MCGNPRNQHFKEKEKLAITERKADISFKEEKFEELLGQN